MNTQIDRLGNQYRILDKLIASTEDKHLIEYILGMIEVGQFRPGDLAVGFYNRCHKDYYSSVTARLNAMKDAEKRI